MLEMQIQASRHLKPYREMMPSLLPSLAIRKFLREELGSARRVLDIGCGNGSMAYFLVSRLNCHIDGVDMDKGKVHRANINFMARMTKGYAICHECSAIDINKLFKGSTFDAAILVHSLHHLPEVANVLLKTKKAMAKNGKVLIMEYDKDYGETVDNCPRFSEEKVRSMLKTAGFSNIRNITLHKNLLTIIAKK